MESKVDKDDQDFFEFVNIVNCSKHYRTPVEYFDIKENRVKCQKCLNPDQ